MNNNSMIRLGIWIFCCLFSAVANSAVDFSQCPFTGPAQTWSNSGKAKTDDDALIFGAVDGKYLGFKDVDSEDDSCDGKRECKAKSSLMVSKPNFVYFSEDKNERKFESDGVLSSDKRYKKVEVLKSATVTLRAGEYWVDEFVIKERGDLVISGKVTLNVNKLILDDSATITHSASPSQFVIIAHKEDGVVELKSERRQAFNAYILTDEEVKISGNTRLHGSVTTKYLEVKEDAWLTADLSGCDEKPLPPDYNENAQFEFGSAYCSSDSCSFDLHKNYLYEPIVILMPTIGKQADKANGENPDSDAPASAFVTDIDLEKKQVTFDIRKPERVAGSVQQMTKVDYLVVEPGIADFNGQTVVAGYVETDKQVYINGAGESNESAWASVSFADFGLTSPFSSSPVVLAQVQSDRNNKWLTAAMRGQDKMTLPPSEGVELSLELSRSRVGSSYEAEKVGFVASLPGSGHIDGFNYHFGRLTTPHVKGNMPLEQGCSVFHDLHVGSISGVVAKKMERNGGHGGWLRRCRINTNQASFVVDEDHYERSHLPEVVGYFAVEQDYEFPEHCEYFPGAAQAHGSSGKIEIYNHSFVYQPDNAFKLGFSEINAGSGLGEASCRTDSTSWMCEIDPDGTVDSMTLPSFPGGGLNESYYDGKTYEISPEDLYQRLEAGSTTVLKLNMSGDYWIRNLTLNGNARLEVANGIKVRLFVENLQTNINSSINHSGEPDNFILIGVGANTRIHLTGQTTFNGMVYSENKVELNSKFTFDNDISKMPATITGAVTAKHIFMSDQSNIRAGGQCFTPVEPEYQIVTLNPQDLSLTCDRQLVQFQVQDKSGRPAGSYRGKVNISTNLNTPNKAFWYLQQEGGESGKLDVSQTHAFSVGDDGIVSLWLQSDVVGTIVATGSLSTDSDEADSGRYGFVPFKFEIEKGHIPIVAGKPANITIKAKSCRDANNSDVAVGYEGKRTLNFSTAYIAPRQGLSSNNSHQLELRKSGITDPDKNWSVEEVELNFDKGVADAQLRYLDAGKTTLTIHDPNCTLDKGCEILPQGQLLSKASIGDWTRLEGTQSVWSRPYTFALCNAGEPYIEGATGTADIPKENNDGHLVAFLPAGRQFSTLVKPVIWQGDGEFSLDGTQSDVDSTALCERQVTQNFFRSDAPATNVALSHRLHTPDNQQQGQLSGTLSLSNTAMANQSYSLSWDEVGSIRLRADTVGDYLGMDINAGYRHVGRFYPDAFVIVSAESGRQYPDGQSFVYMDQPFSARFKVEAQNVDGKPTKNYGAFAPSKQVGLDIAAVDTQVAHGEVNDLGHRIDWGGLPNNWNKSWNGAYITVNGFNLAFKRDVKSAVSPDKALTTKPDGPYDVALGIMREALDTNEAEAIGYPEIAVDHVLFPCDLGQDGCTDADSRGAMEFASFNTRYGRMALDDVSGRFDSELSIPLWVEYWDGLDFVTNKQDSVAAFDGDLSCKQILSQSDTTVTSTSYTRGSGNVKSGDTRSGEFVAVPTEVKDKDGNSLIYREQVRFWQKVIGDSPLAIDKEPEITCGAGPSSGHGNYQPWLTFDWRGKGDESPHSTVTFGAYRGNDRVLYRGEKGINTMLD
ncbi:hypothetical protein BIZ37_20705 [Photobacterium sp. BZF1]|uniref:DUF6701 domain-containing protein n=1 Tax=Photobacterium sp. BZF1 TaxID=1904457 RepID=UPI00165346DD|nr:DUF6701 domain-containing protein [Photobacterium sp. BZF1]MBC7004988.1 hypothetical protein [Photobacterium sp. BZF1]